MPSLPQRKVGIVACSGEELPEGTVTRLAALNTFLSALGVIVLYGLFYLKTTGTYYKLVRFDSTSGTK